VVWQQGHFQYFRSVHFAMPISLYIDPSITIGLQQQIYTEIRTATLTGRFPPRMRLPSSRALASSLGVARMTVTEAYARLISEGYLETRPGSGTFICSVLPEQSLVVSHSGLPVTPRTTKRQASLNTSASASISLSKYGCALQAAPSEDPRRPRSVIRMDQTGPCIASFPVSQWSRVLLRQARNLVRDQFEYARDARGYQPLREAISQYLKRVRSVDCDPNRVVLVSGSQQALDICARILLDANDTVAVEMPCYPAAAQVFASQGARMVHIPVDGAGIDCDALFEQGAELCKATKTPIKLVYVTPSHQFPTGASLSLARRLALLQWAFDNKVLILEDDFDSEYRYAGRPLPSLQGLIPNAPVIYIGTFSRTLFPGLRIGYAVLPEKLVGVFSQAKLLTDRQGTTIDQCALTDFLNEGHLERHILRMRKLYGRRRAILVEALTVQFGDRVRIGGDEAGMHVFAQFSLRIPETTAVHRALVAGVQAGRVHWAKDSARSRSVAFYFGFAALSEPAIREGVRRFAIALGAHPKN